MDVAKYRETDFPQIGEIVEADIAGANGDLLIQWYTGSFTGKWKKIDWRETIETADIFYRKLSLTNTQKLPLDAQNAIRTYMEKNHIEF